MGVAELYACVQVRKWLQCQGVVSGVSAIWRYKIRCKNALGPGIVSRCSEFRGGRFSEVANVLQVWDFQSVTRTLSALGSVSASRSVRSERFYCIGGNHNIIIMRSSRQEMSGVYIM